MKYQTKENINSEAKAEGRPSVSAKIDSKLSIKMKKLAAVVTLGVAVNTASLP